MLDYPIGMIALLVVSILIYFGVGHRVLDRLRLTDRGALAVIAAIILGSFIEIPISSRLTINLGGIVPIILAIYVLVRAGKAYEWIRAIFAAGITAFVLFLVGRFMGAEPEQIFIDPIYIYPIVGGVSGYLAGRSRRGAFFAAVMGVFALDIGHYFWLLRTGTAGTVNLGGGGAFDALVLSGILAVLLAEGVGEILERMQGGPQVEGRPDELIQGLREPQPVRKPLPDKEENDD